MDRNLLCQNIRQRSHQTEFLPTEPPDSLACRAQLLLNDVSHTFNTIKKQNKYFGAICPELIDIDMSNQFHLPLATNDFGYSRSKVNVTEG